MSTEGEALRHGTAARWWVAQYACKRSANSFNGYTPGQGHESPSDPALQELVQGSAPGFQGIVALRDQGDLAAVGQRGAGTVDLQLRDDCVFRLQALLAGADRQAMAQAEIGRASCRERV